jgi:hypothetical protein
MLRFNRKQLLGFTVAGALVVITTAGTRVSADEIVQHLGPVGPHEPILTIVGSKRVLAFYVPDGSHCAVEAIMSDRSGDMSDRSGDEVSPVRFRVSLRPSQVIHLDGAPNASLTLQCSDSAKTLKILAPKEFIAAGAAE